MIPKKIHYCWFGGNPLPDEAKACIASWKKYFPDYEIIEWNEFNFDLDCCEYVKEATSLKKWAYVSDYARFKILNEHGGIYFDTDVEVIKSMEDILEQGPYMGCENDNPCTVNTGLGFASEKGSKLLENILLSYESDHFINEKGEPIFYTVVNRITSILGLSTYNNNSNFFKINDFTIYPSRFFCPLDYNSGYLNLHEDTKTIHHYTASWLPEAYLKRKNKSRAIMKKYGPFWGKLFSFTYMKITGLIKHLK